MIEQTADFKDSRKFTIEFTRGLRGQSVREEKRYEPAAALVVMKGVADPMVLYVTKPRTNIGRLKEILNEDGQMARRNDLVFADNGEEINSTVGRAHALLRFDPQKNEYRIVDEMSRYGTRVFRDNRSIDVPTGSRQGIKLQSGDEIYFGQACVRFDSPAVQQVADS